MLQAIKRLIVIMLACIFLIGCSERPPALDFESAQEELKENTLSLFRLMAEGKEAKAYKTLLHKKVQDTLSEDSFIDISKKIISKLGKLRSVKIGARSDFDQYDGGWLARIGYEGDFKKGKGDIPIAALYENDQWKFMRFNVNSSLLHDNPSEYRRKIELYVTKSDFVLPGAHVNVIGYNNLKENILIEDAQVHNVRWKMSSSNLKDGFITLALSQDQESMLKNANELSVKAVQ